MRDQGHPHLPFPDGPAEQFGDLRLDDHVKGRRRLVRQEEGGVAGKGHGQGSPLSLAPRELVGVTASSLPAQTHLAQKAFRLPVRLPAGEHDALIIHISEVEVTGVRPALERGRDRAGAEGREGLAAFLDKRPANWIQPA